jgi:hypothetical protein
MKHHSDQSRSPRGMFATHLEHGLHEGIGGLGSGQSARIIRHCQRVKAAALEPAQEVANRAWGQVEGQGDGGSILPVSKPLPDRLTDWEGDGTGHGSNSERKSGR